MYRRSQIGTLLLLPTIVAVVVAAAVAVSSGGHALAVAVAVFLGVIASQFTVLTVTVEPGAIRVAFGPGWIRRIIPTDRIAGVRTVRNRWWYGWGIRLTPHGWLWNVQGLDAVEIRYRDGGAFRIGTDDPDGLRRAIESVVAGTDRHPPPGR